MAIFPGSAIPSAVSAYGIDNSCRFEDSDDAFLYEVIGSSATNPLIWTLSFWTKIGRIANGSTSTSYPAGYRRISGTKKAGADATNMEMGFRPGDNLVWYFWIDGANHYGIETTPVYRDEAAWYHFTLIFNAPDSTAADRMQVWVNGERQTATAYGGGLPPDDEDNGFTTNGWTRSLGASIGNVATPTVQYPYPGYLAEVYCIDGQALEPDSFGETDEDTNQWIPKDASDLTFGNNGFYLKFQDSASLGDDSSGNTNDFTSSGLVATDQMIDTPTNNFATLNPLSSRVVTTTLHPWTLSEGNLTGVLDSGGAQSYSLATMSFPSGKWYWEYHVDAIGGGIYGGIGNANTVNYANNNYLHGSSVFQHVEVDPSSGIVYGNIGTRSDPYGNGYTTGDIVMSAFDADNGKMFWGENGTWYDSGDPAAGTNAGATGLDSEGIDTWCLWWDGVYSSGGGITVNIGSDSSFAAQKTSGSAEAQDSNGIGDFYYTPPAGFLTLCTDNLPSPEIALPGENFKTVIWSGDDSTSRSLTVGLTPDFAWAKRRNDAQANWLFDTVRGDGLKLQSGTTSAEVSIVSDGNGIAFASNGVTIGSTNSAYNEVINESGGTYVGWFWKAGGAPTADNAEAAGATPTAGSVKIDGSNLGSALAGTIAATRLSANTTAGFSIVQYDGNATAGATVAHGLSQTPDAIILKYTSSTKNWQSYWSPISSAETLTMVLNDTDGTQASTWLNDTVPASSLFTLGSGSPSNASGGTYVAYCFHSVGNYSKVGSYVGNGNANGPFIYTGFRPAYTLIKCSSASGESWPINDSTRDPYNVITNHTLQANNSNDESAGNYFDNKLDYLSNGIKFRTADGSLNASGQTYLYLTFAESPLKTSNGR